MKKNNLTLNLVNAITKVLKETKGEYKCIKIERNTLFTYYKVEITKD